MDDLLDALARLSARLESMERRLAALEERSSPAPIRGVTVSARSPEAEKFELPQARGVFPVVGKAMLGIAGAYVLRAIAESGSFPRLAVVALALLYAGAWLIWAARIPPVDRLVSTVYATTAALILAPMLAELRLRFQVLPDSATALLLIAFVLGASALAWKRNLTQIAWVAGVTGVLTALALLIASRNFVPYVAALLLMALASESASVRDRWQPLRFLIAPAVDFAVWILIYIHALPGSVRSEYVAIAPGILLALASLTFLIYGTSIAFRNVVLRRRISVFEIGQASISFLLAAYGWFEFARPGLAWFGIACLLLTAAGYAAATICFDRLVEQRAYHVYATWAAALFLAGTFLTLSPRPVTIVLSVASIVAMLAGFRLARVTFAFHGFASLLVAALVSGLLPFVGEALVGTCPSLPRSSIWVVAISVLACYAIAGRWEGEHWPRRLLRLFTAVLAAGVVAAFLVSGLAMLMTSAMGAGAFVAVIRTLITCALALALAFAGTRWQRIELVWTAYGTLAFVTLKLLLEDLRNGHSGSAAISIFLYAVALIVVPRVARASRETG
jgi:hypothetical protein